ncbi:hypothetical protein [Streptomyces microflavus]|uniref:hypothetical protein n=1 Tax=Streptomyces microflavus TaxID=1919 RepID=UPI0036559D16
MIEGDCVHGPQASTQGSILKRSVTQRRPDLKNDFYDQVRACGQMSDGERRLRRQVRRLKELRAADAQESARLKADVERW